MRDLRSSHLHFKGGRALEYKEITGGVTAAKGFVAAGLHCGIKKKKKDLSLIYAEDICTSAAVFTSNIVKGAPILVSKDHLKDNKAQAIIVNSGIANTCESDGVEKATTMTEYAAQELNIKIEDVLVASTGVIGQPLNLEPIKSHMKELVSSLSKDGHLDALHGVMTTDTVPKEMAVEVEIYGTKVTIGGMCKGSGMIEPNMCTMLSFITTDAAIEPALLKEALKSSADASYNKISIDGDTSTNDSLFIMASGKAGNKTIADKDEGYYVFLDALNYVNIALSKKIAKDGEGATKMIQCDVEACDTEEHALIFAKSVIKSSLVKTAMFGCDANWGRIMCALGYAGVDFNPDLVDIAFEGACGRIAVCESGRSIDFDEEKAYKILDEDEVFIKVNMNSGNCAVSAWGCDLSYDYVKINGEYRS